MSLVVQITLGLALADDGRARLVVNWDHIEPDWTYLERLQKLGERRSS